MSGTDTRFEFGKNWSNFVLNCLSEKSISLSVDALKSILHVNSLNEKVFLDIGCGSGLSSLAAIVLGAKKVISFDYDINSVNSSKKLREDHGISPERWEILQGSVLDTNFMESLPQTDVVYSWGVLHHTGDMWTAIDNSANKTLPAGMFSIAIYNKVEGRKGSEKWRKKKLRYVKAPAPVKLVMELTYTLKTIIQLILQRRNPIAYIRDYGNESHGSRGMDFLTDVRDWLGGYPYEFATAGEIFNAIHKKYDMDMVYLKTADGHICNEFTFIKHPKNKN